MIRDKGDLQIYSPRHVISDLGVWQLESLRLKIYGITAEGHDISEAIINDASTFVHEQVPPLVTIEGCSNGLGFVIIHPGSLGVSVLAHWWVQGSVLCQHIQRRLWDSDEPLNMLSRPIIACVWELGLINAEQLIWRNTMMNSTPDPMAYLVARPDIKEV